MLHSVPELQPQPLYRDPEQISTSAGPQIAQPMVHASKQPCNLLEGEGRDNSPSRRYIGVVRRRILQSAH